MTRHGAGPDVRRLVVACDSSAHSLAALEAAAVLAARLGAELVGLFVEDEDLLRLAGLPTTRVLGYRSAAVRRLDVPAMERELQAVAETARRAFASVAAREHVRATFRVTRGRVVTELLGAALGSDWLVLGRSSHAPGPAMRLGATARVVARKAPCAVLFLREGEALGAPVAVVFDGSPAAETALATAAPLGRSLGGRLLVLLAPSAGLTRDALGHRAKEILGSGGREPEYRVLEGRDPRLLAAVVRGLRIRTLVLPAPAAGNGDLEKRLDEVPCPVLVVHGGETAR